MLISNDKLYFLLTKLASETNTCLFKRFSLFYNTTARNERHECDMSATWMTRVRHEWHTNDTNATRVKNFDFHNNTIENIFSHPYNNYMANERLQREEQFHFKNYLLEMYRSHAKMRWKSAPQKLNFVIAKAIPKSYTLECSCKYPCTFSHSYA